jgi:hypothetical protein
MKRRRDYDELALDLTAMASHLEKHLRSPMPAEMVEYMESMAKWV